MDDVTVKIEGGVARIEFSTGGKLNALREQTITELTEAFSDVGLDPNVAVVVLAAGGDHFAPGFDSSLMGTMTPELARRVAYHRCVPLCAMMRNIPQPIIAEVRGVCAGAGLELALFSDLIIADSAARLICVGVNVGLSPMWGANQLLPLIVGEKKAREIIYLAKELSGTEGAELGIVNEAVDADELRATVDVWCARLVEMSPTALRISKRVLNYPFDQVYPSLVHGMEMMAGATGGEVIEGFTAFHEKRQPAFASSPEPKDR